MAASGSEMTSRLSPVDLDRGRGEHLGLEPPVGVGHLDARRDGARVLVEHGADVADRAVEGLTRIGRHRHLGRWRRLRTLASAASGRSAWIQTRLRSATVNIGSLGLASSPSVAFFSMTVPANGAVTAKPRRAAAAGAGRAAEQAQPVGGGAQRGGGLVAVGLRAQEVLARDDLVGVQRLGALEIGLGDAQFGLRLHPAACASPTSTLSSVASVWPARDLVAQLRRRRSDAAFDARRHAGQTVLIGLDGGGDDERFAQACGLTSSTLMPARSASSVVSVSSASPSACSSLPSFFSPACSACLSPSAGVFVLGAALPQASASATQARGQRQRRDSRRAARVRLISVFIVESFLRPAGRVFEFDAGGVVLGQRIVQFALGVERLAVDEQLLEQADLPGLARLAPPAAGCRPTPASAARCRRCTRSRWLLRRLHSRRTLGFARRARHAGALDLAPASPRSSPGRWPRRCA